VEGAMWSARSRQAMCRRLFPLFLRLFFVGCSAGREMQDLRLFPRGLAHISYYRITAQEQRA